MGCQIREGDNYGKQCGMDVGNVGVVKGGYWPKGDWRVWDRVQRQRTLEGQYYRYYFVSE
jgi:hypothetical protein